MKPEQTIPDDYWACECVKRDRKGVMTAIKLHAPKVKRCRKCGTTRAHALEILERFSQGRNEPNG